MRDNKTTILFIPLEWFRHIIDQSIYVQTRGCCLKFTGNGYLIQPGSGGSTPRKKR